MGCDKCGGKGKIRYRTLPSNPDPVDIGNGTNIREGSGWSTRACSCVKDLPAIEGKATWWETESIYANVVPIPIGDEAVEISADCEVPRNGEGRRILRTGENVYYPCLIRLEVPSPAMTLLDIDARALAQALWDAADACDARDKSAMESLAAAYAEQGDPGDDCPF